MNNLYVLIGRSAVGKTTLLNYAVDTYHLHECVSYTTRDRRPLEINNKDYIFIEKSNFLELLINDELIEYTQYNDNLYGLSKNSFNVYLDNIVIVEPKGLEHLKENEYINDNFNIVIIKIEEADDVIRERLVRRGDSMCDINNRLRIDRELFNDIEYDFVISSKFKQLKNILRWDKNV